MSQKDSKFSILIPILESREAPEFLIQAVNNTIMLEFGEVGYDRYDPRTFLHHLLNDEIFSKLGSDFDPLTSDLVDVLQNEADSYAAGMIYFARIKSFFDEKNEDHVYVKEFIAGVLDERGFNHPYKFSEDFISFGKYPPEILYEVAEDYLQTLREIQYIVLIFVMCRSLGPYKNVEVVDLNFKLQVVDKTPVIFCKYCHRLCDSSNTICNKHKAKNLAIYKSRARKLNEKDRIFGELYQGELLISLTQAISIESQYFLRREIDSYLPELSKAAKTITANDMYDFVYQLLTTIDAVLFLENEWKQEERDNCNLIKLMLIYESWEQAFAKSKGRGRPAKFDREDAIRLQEDGYTVKEIATKFGVSPAAVSKKIKLNKKK